MADTPKPMQGTQNIAALARQAGLYDVLGDGTRWQSADGPSVSTKDLLRLVQLALGAIASDESKSK